MIQDFKSVLKNTNFLYIWTSQILSQLAINIMNFLLLTRLFETTGSSIATSLLWVAYALPAIIIGPFAAASVDMVAKRKMLMVTNLLQSLTIFVYAFLHRTSVFLLYGVALTYSFLNQFYIPAEASTLPSVVPKNRLPQANSLFFFTQQSSMILGFGFAGILMQFLGFDRTLFIGAAFLFVAFVSTTFLPELPARQEIPKKLDEAIISFFERIMEGYNFIKENRRVLLPFILLLCLQVGLAIITVNVPLMAQEIWGISLNSAGVSIVVPAGIGAILGALAATRLLKKGWRKKQTIETFMMLTITGLFILVFVVPELSGFVRILFSVLSAGLLGFSFIGMVIPAQTYLQEATPGGLRGRVFGNFWFLATVATIFPVVFSGTVAELFGIRLLLFLLGALLLAGLIFSKRYGQKFLEGDFNGQL